MLIGSSARIPSSPKQSRGENAQRFARVARGLVRRFAGTGNASPRPAVWDGLAWLHLWVWNDNAAVSHVPKEFRPTDIEDDLSIRL
jgi:hypothetical protein